MTLLKLQSKSCGLAGDSDFASLPPQSPPRYNRAEPDEEEDTEYEAEEEEDEDLYSGEFEFDPCHAGSDMTSSSPSSRLGSRDCKGTRRRSHDWPYSCDVAPSPFVRPGFEVRRQQGGGHQQIPILAVVSAALRKSLVTCSVEREDISSIDISGPMDVRHVSHVTFDRFNGFLGLPVELEPEIPTRVPSASVSVFGVSPRSMQCSIDERGNSVPTILLMMQRRLYAEGGLHAEGIFRINAENSQEEWVRSQLNRGVVPRAIDVHCLAGLIKAWFRELPKGVLDSLTPEQVMHCNTEDECTRLADLLPPMEAALLDWAINLMADIVENEHHNKMNARNIAMVFAPNMTQMADPLTALIHAVQVMNFLKTLITKTLCDRQESSTELDSFTPNSDTKPEQKLDLRTQDAPHYSSKLIRTATLDRLEFSAKLKSQSTHNKYTEDGSKPRHENGEEEGIVERLSFREGVKKLCRHTGFQLSKSVKKDGSFEVVNI